MVGVEAASTAPDCGQNFRKNMTKCPKTVTDEYLCWADLLKRNEANVGRGIAALPCAHRPLCPYEWTSTLARAVADAAAPSMNRI